MPKGNKEYGATHAVAWVNHASRRQALPLGGETSVQTGHASLRSALHTVDVDRTGERFVTAGADKTVRVWSMAALGTADHAPAPPAEAALAAIQMGSNSINAARFANTRDCLAVGDCNGWIFTFNLEPGPGVAEFGSDEAPSRENWRISRRVMIHPNSDVMDLAWTADDLWLASAGLDSEVVVLNGSTLAPVIHLTCDGPPKGVAWSPAGGQQALPLLAAQVDVLHREQPVRPFMVWDPSRAWQALSHDKCTERIHQGTSQSIHSMRISWSPIADSDARRRVVFVNARQEETAEDGSVKYHGIAVEYQAKQSLALADLLRGGKIAFPFTAARFSPKVWSYTKEGASERTLGEIWAMLSSHGMLTMWRRGELKPVFVSARKAFRLPGEAAPEKQTPNDLAWAPSGRKVLAVSESGILLYANLPETDLQDPPAALVAAAAQDAAARAPGDHHPASRAVPAEAPAPETTAAVAAAKAATDARRQSGQAVPQPDGGMSDGEGSAGAPEQPQPQLQTPQQERSASQAPVDPKSVMQRAANSAASMMTHKFAAGARPGAAVEPSPAPPPRGLGLGVGSRAGGLLWAGTEEHQEPPPAGPPTAAQAGQRRRIAPEAVGQISTTGGASPGSGPLGEARARQHPQAATPTQRRVEPTPVAAPAAPAEALLNRHARPVTAVPDSCTAAEAPRRRLEPTPVPARPPSPVLLSSQQVEVPKSPSAGASPNAKATPPTTRRIAPTPASAPATSPKATTPTRRRIAPTPASLPSTSPKPAKKQRRMEPQRVEPPPLGAPVSSGRQAQLQTPSDEPRRIQPQQISPAGGPRTQKPTEKVGIAAGRGPVVQRSLVDASSGIPEEHGADQAPASEQGTATLAVTTSSLLAEVEALGGGGRRSGWKAAGRQGPVEAAWEEAGAGDVCLSVQPTGEVRLVAGGVVLWEEAFAPGAVHACGSPDFCAVAAPGGLVQFFDRWSGARPLPPLRVGSAVLSLSATGPQCVVATPQRLFVWDAIEALKDAYVAFEPETAGTGANDSNTSMAPKPVPVSSPMPSSVVGRVRSAKLAPSGAPVVLMDNGEVYVWHRQLEAWALVAGDESGAGLQASRYTGMARPPGGSGAGRLGAILEEAFAASGRRAPAVSPRAIGPAAGKLGARQSIAHLTQNAMAARMIAEPCDLGEAEEWRRELARFVAALGSANGQAPAQ